MKAIAATLFALFLIGATPADATGNCVQSHRFGSSLVLVGDSERKVRQSAGRPDVERQLETRHGGAAGIRLDYYERNATIQIYIRGGIVARICRVTD